MGVFYFNSLKSTRHTQDTARSYDSKPEGSPSGRIHEELQPDTTNTRDFNNNSSKPELERVSYINILSNKVGRDHDLIWVSWAHHLRATPTDMQSIPSSFTKAIPPITKCGGMQPSMASLLFICAKTFLCLSCRNCNFKTVDGSPTFTGNGARKGHAKDDASRLFLVANGFITPELR